MRKPTAPLALGLIFYATTIVWTLTRKEMSWLGDPLWGQESIAFAAVIGLPIYLGAVAYDAGLDAREVQPLVSRAEAVRATVVTASQRLLWAAAVLVLAHASVVGLSNLQSFSFNNASLWPLTAQLIALGVGIFFATIVGSKTNGWGGAAVSGVAWVVVMFADRAGILPTGISEFTPSGSLLGYAPDSTQFSVRVAWMLTVAAALVIAIALINNKTWSKVALGVALCIFLSGLVVNQQGDGYTYTAGSREACVGSSPAVCGPDELSTVLQQFAPTVREARTASEKLGANLPERYVAWTANNDAQHRSWLLLIDPGKPRQVVDPASVISQVIAPRSCRVWFDSEPPSPAWFEAERLVSAYVEKEIGAGPGEAYVSFTRDMTPSRADAVVSASAKALATCEPTTLPSEVTSYAS